jgi:hypothetical protein
MQRSESKAVLARVGWLVAIALLGLPAVASAQVETRLGLDPSRSGVLFEKQTPERFAPDILKNALTVQNESSVARSLVVFAFRVSRGRIASSFESRPFSVRSGASIVVPETSLPPASAYGGKLLAAPEDFIVSRRAVRAEEGIRSAVKYITNGIFVGKPEDWSERDAMYVIVVPADPALRAEAMAYPMAVFLNEGR